MDAQNIADALTLASKATPLGIVFAHTDRDLRYTWILNSHADFRAGDAIGKTDLEIHDDDGTRRLFELKQRVLDTGKGEWEEIQFSLSNGSFTHRIAVEPRIDDDGGCSGVSTASIDVTSRTELDEKNRQLLRMEAVSQLTGGVAHDFNNLLSVMIGNTEMLEDRTREDASAQHHIGVLFQAIDNATSLTNRLLAFSRQQPLAPEATEISNRLSNLEDWFRRTLGTSVDMVVNTNSALRPAVVDPHQFDNALLNLALNARDAMPDAGVLTIKADNTRLDPTDAHHPDDITPGDYICIQVSDTGVGMSAEVLGKVFEPFFTTKDVGNGNGLGLSMVYGFAKQSKGHVSIESLPGAGTTVFLYLPAARENPAAAGASAVVDTGAAIKPTVLLVEDDPMVRETTAALLKRVEYLIYEAADGPSALAKLQSLADQEIAVDLVLSDVVMPNDMSGVELADHVLGRFPAIKVLLMSGYPNKITDQDGLKSKGIELIAKPFKRDTLIAAIERITTA